MRRVKGHNQHNLRKKAMQVLESSTRVAIKNILFLTDFTEASQPAMDYAIELGQRHGARFYAGHVQVPESASALEEPALTEFFNAVREQRRAKLSELVKGYKLETEVLLAQGGIEYAIQRWTVLHGIDLIVIGTHGRQGLQRMLLGSNAELILRIANCPVLTVGPHVSRRKHDGDHLDRVLFATDLTPQSEYAISYALSFAHERCARLTCMHVIDRTGNIHDGRRIVSHCEKELRRLIPSDAALWCEPNIVVGEGEPAEEIVAFAEQDNSDLIVLGLPREKMFSSHFRSGVTYCVVSNAPCPVLTVRDMLT
ncbi:MAG TPA: universal stress protein [Terriglobales bacterium]|nr:universal stress protein [Terriglobales bacterium]